MYRYIFDIGGVLVKYDHEKELKFLTASGTYDPEAIEKLFTHELICTMETGRIPVTEFYEEYLQQVMPDITYETWVDKYTEYFEMNPEGFELMLALKRAGRKIYLLSNLAEYHKVAIGRKIPGFFGHCEQRFLSFEMGCRKPEPEIYRRVIDEIGEEPENLVFFDDLPQNIEGPKKAGIKGIVFSNERIGEICKQVEMLETGKPETASDWNLGGFHQPKIAQNG